MIIDDLLKLKNPTLQDFEQKLIPNIAKSKIIGIYTNDLKAYAKEIKDQDTINAFFKDLPHYYFEENQLHAFLLNNIKDFSYCIKQVDHFLSYIDNWATCDQLKPKAFNKKQKELLPVIKEWLKSNEVYRIRFAIKCLMNYYLTNYFSIDIIELVINLKNDDYYCQMMMAWFLQVALVKQKDATLPYFKEQRINPWVKNKAIQKARESRLISDELKEELLKYKVKE